ncbi:MAG: hypothetical protein AAGF11_15225 [Myxococcota bacterium]
MSLAKPSTSVALHQELNLNPTPPMMVTSLPLPSSSVRLPKSAGPAAQVRRIMQEALSGRRDVSVRVRLAVEEHLEQLALKRPVDRPTPSATVLTNFLFISWDYCGYYGIELGRYVEHWSGLDRAADNEQIEQKNTELEGFEPLVRMPPGTFLSGRSELVGWLEDVRRHSSK